MKRQVIAAMLCAVTALAPAACSAKPEGEMITMSEEDIKSSLSYKVTDIPIPDSIILGDRLSVRFAGNDGMKIVGAYRQGKKNITTVTAFNNEDIIYSTDISDSSVNDPEEKLRSMFLAPDNTLCCALNGNGTRRVVTLSPSGEIVSDQDFTAVVPRIENILLSDGKYIIDTGRGSIAVTDLSGQVMFEAQIKDYPPDTMGSSLAMTSEGDAILSYSYMGKDGFYTKMSVLDMKTKKFGKVMAIEGHGSIFSGSGEYLYYIRSDTGISGVRKDGTSDLILGLLNLGVNNDSIESFYAAPDGSFLFGVNSLVDNIDPGFISIDHLEGEDAERKIITLGCFEMPSEYRSKIAEFNRRSDEYLVVVSSFSENREEDRDQALIRFNTQLVSGDIPDIVIVNKEMPFDSYIKKGMFTDLYPFIDNDPDVSREDFFKGSLRAGENNGRLYSMLPVFTVDTCISKGSVTGDERLLTIDRARETVASMGDGAALTFGFKREDALRYAILFSGMIDFENGTCDFDNDDFKQLLAFVREFPETIESPERGSTEYLEQEKSYMDEKTLIKPYHAFTFLDLPNQNLIFDGDMSFVSFPSSSPSSNAVISSLYKLAISEQSENKQGAWEFVKYAMESNIFCAHNGYYDDDGAFVDMNDDNYFCISGFPSYKKDFDLCAGYLMKNDHDYEDGRLKETKRKVNFANSEVETDPFTKEQMERFTAMLDGECVPDRTNSQIMTIINDEANAYFAGAQDVDTAAAHIQSRMSIYMNEQYN